MTCGSTRHELTPCGMPCREPMRLPSVWLSPPAAGPGQREREPRPELTLGARLEVGGLRVRRQQARLQPAQRLERERVLERVAAACEQRLDGVVDGANAGREPQLERRLQRQLGVEDDCPWNQRLAAQADFLVLVLGGEAGQA